MSCLIESVNVNSELGAPSKERSDDFTFHRGGNSQLLKLLYLGKITMVFMKFLIQ